MRTDDVSPREFALSECHLLSDIQILSEKRADVFADAVGAGDVETTVAGEIENVPGDVGGLCAFAIENDGAGSGDDFHVLGSLRAEMVGAGLNQAESFVHPLRVDQRVTHHPSIEINIGLGVRGYVGKFSRDGGHDSVKTIFELRRKTVFAVMGRRSIPVLIRVRTAIR